MRCFFRRLLNRFHFLFTRRVVERADSDGLAESNVLGGLKGGLFFQVRLSQLHFHCFHIPSNFCLISTYMAGRATCKGKAEAEGVWEGW